MTGISLNMFMQEFEKLDGYKKEIYATFYEIPTNESSKYKRPIALMNTISSFIKKQGRDDLLNICGRCGGTGLYDMHTSYTDSKGNPTCFKCNGSGSRLKKLSKGKLLELKALIDSHRAKTK